jgi:hypothetical protein
LRNLLVAVLCVGLATPVAFAFAADDVSSMSTEKAVAATANWKRVHEAGRHSAIPVGRRIHAEQVEQRERREARREQQQAEQAVADVAGGPTPETLASIRACESGGDYTSDTGNGFYGAYQFMQGTWEAVGGTGNPAEASPAEQDKRAAMLYEQSGAGQWPVCGA